MRLRQGRYASSVSNKVRRRRIKVPVPVCSFCAAKPKILRTPHQLLRKHDPSGWPRAPPAPPGMHPSDSMAHFSPPSSAILCIPRGPRGPGVACTEILPDRCIPRGPRGPGVACTEILPDRCIPRGSRGPGVACTDIPATTRPDGLVHLPLLLGCFIRRGWPISLPHPPDKERMPSYPKSKRAYADLLASPRRTDRRVREL